MASWLQRLRIAAEQHGPIHASQRADLVALARARLPSEPRCARDPLHALML